MVIYKYKGAGAKAAIKTLKAKIKVLEGNLADGLYKSQIKSDAATDQVAALKSKLAALEALPEPNTKNTDSTSGDGGGTGGVAPDDPPPPDDNNMPDLDSAPNPDTDGGGAVVELIDGDDGAAAAPVGVTYDSNQTEVNLATDAPSNSDSVSADPASASTSNIPTWVWIVGGLALLYFLTKGKVPLG